MPNAITQLNEEGFEKYITRYLVDVHSYERRDFSRGMYDQYLAMDTGLVKRFLEETQGEKLKKLKDLRGDDMWAELFARLDKEIVARGVIDCLRNGFTHVIDFDLMYFMPRSGRNEDVQALYEKNIFSVMRQVEFNNETKQSLDAVVFLNGLPIFTFELKNENTGQTVVNAMRQYRTTRDSDQKLFSFKRCVAHFAVDTSEIFVTTKLAGEATYFLPFNKGCEGGKGNPVVEGKHKTHYLWEEVLTKQSVSELLESFVHVITEEYEDRAGNVHEREIQVFPRYQQRRAVRSLVAKSREVGVGRNYLIQHSAGSGKSMTIAMTAYQLSELHDESSNAIFDTIFVLTDRRVLNKQLGNTVRAFESTPGVLETIIDGTSRDLLAAVERGTKIISTTIQKFPIIVDQLAPQTGKKFALIVDEAHSSQSGSTAQQVQIALGDGDEEAWIAQQTKGRAQPGNVSYFAFTATPKDETLQLFGDKQANGEYTPFDSYSMRQAIEEGFILDVLKNYITYHTFYKVAQKVPDDPMLPRGKSIALIRRYVRLETIDQKVEIIAEHFEDTVRALVGGEAKAMIVTSSREEAVRYKLAMDRYIAGEGYDYKTLVAFTDSVRVDGVSYTETEMNRFPESRTAKEFKKPEYKFLIVAEKYQTGFDEPMLSAMYVDKKLSGVAAVQTLSRLNRMARDKDDVFVLDFVNEARDIVTAFKPYFETTILSEGFDVNAIADLKRKIFSIYHFKQEDIESFAGILGSENDQEKHPAANALLDRVVADVLRLVKGGDGTDEDEDDDYQILKANMRKYIQEYPFLSRVIGYYDEGNEKLFWILRYVLKKLPREKGGKPIDIEKFVEFKKPPRVVRQKGADTGIVADGAMDPDNVIPTQEIIEDPIDYLSKIIEGLNARYGTDFGKQQLETLQTIETDLSSDEEAVEVMKNSPKDAAQLVFDKKFDSKVDDQFDDDKKFWDKVNENIEIKRHIRSEMFRHLFAVTNR
jgi:type I restriction enzyme, R subunit